MITQELINYIKQTSGLGISKEDIKNNLLQNGWVEADIDEGFKHFNSPETIQKRKISPAIIVKILLPIIILIILILLGIGYIVHYRTNNKVISQITPNTSSQPTATETNSPTQQEEDLIFGEWFPLSTSEGGLGSGINFVSNGEVFSGYGAYLNHKYKIEGDTLTYIFSEQTKTPDLLQKFKLEGSKLTITSSDGKTEELVYGGGPHNGIIGRWIGPHYTGGQQIVYFTNSQEVYTVVRAASVKGNFKIKGNTIELSGEINGIWQWSIDGNILTLTTSDGKKTAKYIKLDSLYL